MNTNKNMNKPKVSVVIPVYNVREYLAESLDSVINQSYKNLEIMLINDGSDDGSEIICEEYAKKDKRFVVVHKENGGLSDARNAGFKHAKGEYIMYLDSDDFIHPQTMEIAYHFAQRDKSDMVSFTYDRIYRPRLMVRYKLGLSTNNVVPWGIHKKYDLNKIDSLVTDDIFEYATERSHNATNKKRRWLIKHCQVWKNMYRRELIADIPFIKGILFEDFPWWSAVMLKNPRVTIVNLPLYYYIPNFGGIVLSAKQLRILQSLCIGVLDSYKRYKENATDYQMKKWSEQFLWYFIYWPFRKIRYLKTEKDLETARRLLIGLRDAGVFDDVPNEWYDLRNKIYEFISE